MPELNPQDLKKALRDAGLEVFRVRDSEVHLAERQNVQLMEAGVRVRGGASPRVLVTARAQRNDAPARSAEDMFSAVRAAMASLLAEGYQESSAQTRELRSVSDPDQIVDLWFEVTFERAVESIEEAVAQARKVMAHERYVRPHG